MILMESSGLWSSHTFRTCCHVSGRSRDRTSESASMIYEPTTLHMVNRHRLYDTIEITKSERITKAG